MKKLILLSIFALSAQNAVAIQSVPYDHSTQTISAFGIGEAQYEACTNARSQLAIELRSRNIDASSCQEMEPLALADAGEGLKCAAVAICKMPELKF